MNAHTAGTNGRLWDQRTDRWLDNGARLTDSEYGKEHAAVVERATAQMLSNPSHPHFLDLQEKLRRIEAQQEFERTRKDYVSLGTDRQKIPGGWLLMSTTPHISDGEPTLAELGMTFYAISEGQFLIHSLDSDFEDSNRRAEYRPWPGVQALPLREMQEADDRSNGNRRSINPQEGE